MFDYEGENDPDFDESKADRNNDGKISDWEKSVGNAVAKSMREQKEKKSAEGFEAENYANWMIKTDKYDGHNTDDRIWYEYSRGLTSDYVYYANQADDNLVEDAPKILNAYKKLLAENLRLKQKVRGLEIAYDSVIDVVNEFIETDYISDDGADYLRYNLDLDAQFEAEELNEMGYPLNMRRFSYREGTTMNYHGMEVVNFGIYFGDDWMFNVNNVLFGYDEQGVQKIVDELNDSIRSSMSEVFQRLLWKSQRHDSLDVMLRSEEFQSEFSKGEMLNLKKYIDYPISWINKQIAPSNERKARKFEQKERGQIPTKREPEDFRQSIETPTWFKAVQLGLIASVVGVMGLVDTKRTTDEEPEEPEEQKEE